MLAIGPDGHGGMGVFANEDIHKDTTVTSYLGVVRYPGYPEDKKHYTEISKTHSLHILPRLDVPVEQARFRVIDGSWAPQAMRMGAEARVPLPASLANCAGSMINSCWNDSDRTSENVTTDSLSYDDVRFQYRTSATDSVREHLTPEQLQDIWGDAQQQWLSLAMVATRHITKGEELLWSYPFKRSR